MRRKDLLREPHAATTEASPSRVRKKKRWTSDPSLFAWMVAASLQRRSMRRACAFLLIDGGDGAAREIGIAPARTAGPFPIANFRQVFTVRLDVLFVLQELVTDVLLGVGGVRLQPRHAVDHVVDQVEAIKLVEDD